MKCQLGSVENLTVGKLFDLGCQSDSNAHPEFADLNPEKVELRLSESDQYKVKLIQVEKFSPTEIKLVLTSYRAGDHALKALQIIEGEKSYVLGDLQFSVASVMKPEEPASEPYSSMGPLGVHLPFWYWVVLAGFVSLVVLRIYWAFRKKAQKKKLLQLMQIDTFANAPLAQFFQSLRKLQRSYAFFSGGEVDAEEMKKFVEELDQAFKLYLARIYQVPTFYWSERKILAEIKAHYRAEYAELRLVFRKSLAELSRARLAQGKMSARDAVQLNDLIRKQTDQIESVKNKRLKKAGL